jgi:hypothetical protein
VLRLGVTITLSSQSRYTCTDAALAVPPQQQIKHGDIMRRLLAIVSKRAVSLPGVFVGASLISFTGPYEARALPAGILHGPACGVELAFAFEPGRRLHGDMSCADHPAPSMELTEARAYLVETASPGYTMTRQGPGLAIERLHPEFAIRLANAIREARESGLRLAGIFSAYRPPAFGVGGFSDKFNSLHAYGLAVDLAGIGEPGSVEAERWHEIAAKRGVICPYGPRNAAEWNHCQPTSLKLVLADSPLRDTISADGPLSLETMFERGDAVIESSVDAVKIVGKELPAEPVVQRSPSLKGKRRGQEASANGRRTRASRLARARDDDDD